MFVTLRRQKMPRHRLFSDAPTPLEGCVDPAPADAPTPSEGCVPPAPASAVAGDLCYYLFSLTYVP